MGSVLKLLYDKWFIDKDGNKFPLPNVLPEKLVTFSKEHASREGIRILENRYFLENELSRENNKEILRFFHCNFFSYFVKNNGFENIVDVDSIEENDDVIYIYPIELKNYDMLWIEQTYTLNGKEHSYTVLDTITEKVIDLLKKQKVRIVASIPFEPVNDIGAIVKFREQLKILGVENDDSVMCVGGNKFPNTDNVKVCAVNLPLTQAAEDFYKHTLSDDSYYYGGLGYASSYVLPKELDKSRIRKYKFLSFNRSMNRYHRVMLAHTALEHDLLKEGIFSFIGGDILTMSDNPHRDIERPLREHFKSYDIYKSTDELEFYIERIKSLIPYEIDTQHLSLTAKCGFSTNNNKKDFYLDTYINITSESRFGKHRGVFFSEKTYRPILNLQPFIILGDVGTLLELHNLGFKTFHPFIDESYDMETRTVERFNLIQKEILKLNKKSIEEIHEWYYSIQDILIHNQNVLKSYHTVNPFGTFIEQSGV